MKLLERTRRLQRLSQAALSHETGIHFTTISQIETGRTIPTAKELVRIAGALGYKGDPMDLAQEVPDDARD